MSDGAIFWIAVFSFLTICILADVVNTWIHVRHGKDEE